MSGRIQRADMELPEAIGEAIKQFLGETHARIEGTGMSEVQAEAGIRQDSEQRRQVAGRLPTGLPEVHVLDDEAPTQRPEGTWLP